MSLVTEIQSCIFRVCLRKTHIRRLVPYCMLSSIEWKLSLRFSSQTVVFVDLAHFATYSSLLFLAVDFYTSTSRVYSSNDRAIPTSALLWCSIVISRSFNSMLTLSSNFNPFITIFICKERCIEKTIDFHFV